MPSPAPEKNKVKPDSGEKTERKVGAYPFKPKEASILTEGKALADAYGISLNQLLTFALESCIEEWTVPYMTKRPRKGEKANHPDNDGVYEKPLTED